MEPGDLIDFETVIETTQQELKKGPRLINSEIQEFINHEFQKYIEGRRPIFDRGIIYYYCDWLKLGKNERCGKRCKEFYCSKHTKSIDKGCEIPLPCLYCGAGSRRPVCNKCEKRLCLKV